jgi:hypothetical protein
MTELLRISQNSSRVLAVLASLVAGQSAAVAQVVPLQFVRPCNAKTATVWEFVAFRTECGPLEMGDAEIPLGPTCFDLPFSPWVSCGAGVTFTASGEVGLQFSLACIGGVEAGISVGLSGSHSIQSSPCNRCIGSICFQSAMLGLRAMQRSVPQWQPDGNIDPNEFGGLLASKRCKIITGYRTERYTLVTLRPGNPTFNQRCEPNDCLCQMQGQDCHCDGQRSGQSTMTERYPIPAEDTYTITLSEFRQGDMYRAPIADLDDLCLLELALLRRFVDSCGIACESGTVLLRVSDGGFRSMPTYAVTKAIALREAILGESLLYKDANRDGRIDGTDLGEIILQTARSMNGETIDQRADLNADGLIDSRDIEVFFSSSVD